MNKLLTNCLTVANKQTLSANNLFIRYASTGKPIAAAAQAKVADAAAADKKAKKQAEAAPVESTSFAMNLFRGKLQLDEIFPYPYSLNEEQRENLQALVDPTAKFFEVFFFFTNLQQFKYFNTEW